MNNKTMTSAEAILRDRKKRGARNALLLCLAILVVAGVVGVFHLPATAKTYQKWVLTCPAEAPAGPGYAGFFLHTHNDDCFDENGNLVCPLPEIKAHVHDENCFVVSRELDCAIPESDGHQHTAECYTRVRGDLTCTLSTEPVLDEEGNVLEEGHVHTDMHGMRNLPAARKRARAPITMTRTATGRSRRSSVTRRRSFRMSTRTPACRRMRTEASMWMKAGTPC